MALLPRSEDMSLAHNLLPSARRAGLVAALALAASTAACPSLGQYVWVAEYRDPRPPPAANAYVLGAGDLVQVSVYNQEGMSARTKVRTDGKISLPFLNDVQAEGYTPNVLAEQLESRLKDYVNKPVVTVTVEEQRLLKVAVIGEVSRQGILDVAPDAGVLQALANAGGLTETASSDRIFVIRNDPQPTRIRFTYRELLQAVPPASTFRLRSGDQIVVE
jgi:polysaccharide export outer membrane protein